MVVTVVNIVACVEDEPTSRTSLRESHTLKEVTSVAGILTPPV